MFKNIGELAIFIFYEISNRKICSSISNDEGKTWENIGMLVDNFELKKHKKALNEDCFNKFNID